MFESIKAIGEALLQERAVSLDIERIKGKGTKLAKITFDLDKGVFDCDCDFECNEERAKEFLWVGNAIGQKPQLFLTTDNPEYLLNNTKGNKWAIGQIIEKINEMYLTDEDEDMKSLREILLEIKTKFFEGKTDLILELKNIFGKKGTRIDDIALYTVAVKKKGELVDLVKEPGYKKFLYFALYETRATVKGRCHICGEEKAVLIEPAYPEGTLLCLYNIDKAGFISGIGKEPENLLKTHAVCVDCKKKLRLGLRFIEQKLHGSIDGIEVFIIPTTIGVGPSKVIDVFSKFKEAFNIVASYGKLRDVEMDVDEYQKFIEPSLIYMLNILFGHRVSSHFTYQCLIQNVPVTRLLEVGKKFEEASFKFAELFQSNANEWSISFSEIYKIFPLRKSGTELIEWKPIVELFNAILSGSSYPKENIITKAVLFSRIHRYKTWAGYNIKPSKSEDQAMCKGLLKHNLLLLALNNINVIELGGGNMGVGVLPDKNIEEFLSTQRYEEWQSALFLLGVLVGKIGIEQYKKGDEKKSVLDKIGFEGTSVDRVKILANYVLEGMRNYRILDDYNEAIYGCMKELLDRNTGKLHNPIENTFYLLSGYAYITYRTITSGGS